MPAKKATQTAATTRFARCVRGLTVWAELAIAASHSPVNDARGQPNDAHHIDDDHEGGEREADRNGTAAAGLELGLGGLHGLNHRAHAPAPARAITASAR